MTRWLFRWWLAVCWPVAVLSVAFDVRTGLALAWWGWLAAGLTYAAWAFTTGINVRGMILSNPHPKRLPNIGAYSPSFCTVQTWAWFCAVPAGLFWPVGIPWALIARPHLERNSIHGPSRQTQTNPPDPHPATGSVDPFAAGTIPGYYAIVTRANAVTEPPVETVIGDMPILAHRAARLVATRDGVRFSAINEGFGTFGVDADARCRRPPVLHSSYTYTYNRPHVAPALGCDCGFYAVPADVDAWHANETVDLLVELSGTVIEHELGYRAGHQTVVECHLPACPYCREPSVNVIFEGGKAAGFACERHTAGSVVVSRDDLRRTLGVPITDEAPL